MAYRISDITLNAEPNKISISTILQCYEVIPAVPPSVEFPDGIPEHDEIKWSKQVSSSSKVNIFDNPSLAAAKVILINKIEDQLKYWKKLMDRKYALENSDILTTLKASIQAKLDLIP